MMMVMELVVLVTADGVVNHCIIVMNCLHKFKVYQMCILSLNLSLIFMFVITGLI
jgi:hypothetical protein